MSHANKLFFTALVVLATACSTEKDAPSNAAAPTPVAAPAPVTTLPPPVVTPPPPPTPVVTPPPAEVSPPTQDVPSAPASTVLTVLSVNGLAVDGSGTVTVTPGEPLTLVADVLAAAPGCQSISCAEREGLGVDQFTWSADDRISDICDGSTASLCGRTSNFSVAGNSVIFLVPRDMRGDITITVRQNGTALVSGFILKLARAKGGRGSPGNGPVGNRGHGNPPGGQGGRP